MNEFLKICCCLLLAMRGAGQQCNVGYFASSGACVACSSNCLACSVVSANCTYCAFGSSLVSSGGGLMQCVSSAKVWTAPVSPVDENNTKKALTIGIIGGGITLIGIIFGIIITKCCCGGTKSPEAPAPEPNKPFKIAANEPQDHSKPPQKTELQPLPPRNLPPVTNQQNNNAAGYQIPGQAFREPHRENQPQEDISDILISDTHRNLSKPAPPNKARPPAYPQRH